MTSIDTGRADLTDTVPAIVHEVVRLVTPQRPAEVRDGQQLIGDLGFHSLALAELAFTLEDLFGLDAITPERAMTLKTVGDISELILASIGTDQARVPELSQLQDVCAQYGAAWDGRG